MSSSWRLSIHGTSSSPQPSCCGSSEVSCPSRQLMDGHSLLGWPMPPHWWHTSGLPLLPLPPSLPPLPAPLSPFALPLPAFELHGPYVDPVSAPLPCHEGVPPRTPPFPPLSPFMKAFNCSNISVSLLMSSFLWSGTWLCPCSGVLLSPMFPRSIGATPRPISGDAAMMSATIRRMSR